MFYVRIYAHCQHQGIEKRPTVDARRFHFNEIIFVRELGSNWSQEWKNWHILISIFITHLMNENDLEFLCYKFFKWSTSVLYWTMDKCTSIGKGVDLRPAPNSSDDADETETWTIYLFIHCIYVISLHSALSLSLSRLFNLHLWLHAVTHFAKKIARNAKSDSVLFFLTFLFGLVHCDSNIPLRSTWIGCIQESKTNFSL